MQVYSFNIVFSYTVCSPVLWIRLQIGSIFSNLVDPDPYSEHGSRSGYTQTQTDINSPSQSKLSLCAFNFVLYSLKQVFWINKLYKKIDNELCEKVRFRIQIGANVRIWIQIKYIWIHNTDVLYCEKLHVHVHRTVQVFVLQNKHSSDELFHQTCFLWRYTLLLI